MKKTNTTARRVTFKRTRPYIHAKNNSSGVKSSKNYLKVYRGQGRH